MKFAILVLCCVGFVNGAWQVDPPFYAQQYATVRGVRGIIVDPAGDLLAVSSGESNVYAIYEQPNDNGTIDVVQQLILSGAGLRLNHGLAYNNGYLYASRTSTVYRWPYTPGSRTQINVGEEIVVQGIPTGGHDTRTLIFDPQGRLYVSVGSNANVDNNSIRARINRFTLAQTLPLEFNEGQVFADGLRNEVGLAFDLNGVLHGVENGADMLNRPDLGGDIHNGNPAEEFNRFNRTVGTHYGYPYCFSTHNLAGYEKGTQFAWPTFMNDGVHTDAWCRDLANNQTPLFAMPAHNAPLGFDFFRGQSCGNGNGAFPCEMRGDAFVAFHGSWNANPPTGYRMARIPFDTTTGEPTGEDINILYEPSTTSCPNNCVRPVDVAFNAQGHLFVSADANNAIFKVTYGVPPRTIKNQITN